MKLTKRQKLAVASIGLVGVLLAVGLIYLNGQLGPGVQPTSSSDESLTNVSDAQRLPVIKLRLADSYLRTVEHTGTVQSRSHTMVAFQRGGLVTELIVDEGQHVTSKQQLAVLDQRHLQAQIDSLNARLAQAESVLAELEKGPRQESIDTARNVVTDLEEQLKAQELRAQRSETLLESNSIARQDYERELYAKRGLEARLSAAQSQLEELLAGTRPEQLDAQKSLIRSIQAEQKVLQYNLDDCLLEAPFAGMIVTRYIDPGAVVTAGTPIYELIDDKNLEVHVGIPHSLVDQLESGATYTVLAGKARLNGTLRVVLPRVDAATRTCKAILDVRLPDDMPARLLTGQLARVELAQEIHEPGFWIPRLALTADHSGLWSCFVVDGESQNMRARKQTVEILHQRDEWVFVRGTLRPGQLLISDGMHRVVPGQRVQVQTETDMDSTDLSAIPASLESTGAN